MNARKIDVLIATNGRCELLETSLRSLLLAVPLGYIRKIIIVENGSKEGAEEICHNLAKAGPVEYHWHEEANKSMALNHGLSFCDDGLIFMTDDDIIIDPDVIKCYATKTLEWNEKAFFGGPTTTEYEEEPDDFIKSFLPASAKGWSSSSEKMGSKGFFIGFNWAAFKSDLIEAGGFNPDFGPGGRTGATGQESEMQRRLYRIGAQSIYLETLPITHQVPKSRCSREWLLKRSFRQGVERGIVHSRKSIEEAKLALVKERQRNRLQWVKSLLLMNANARFKHQFYARRTEGFAKALSLYEAGKLEESPFLNPIKNAPHIDT